MIFIATQYANQATGTTTIDGKVVNFSSNTVTAELLDTTLVTMVKTQNKGLVATGSTMTYTIAITNLSLFPITNFSFNDIIPTGMTYVNNSFKVNATAQTPIIAGQNLSYTIASLIIGLTTVSFDCTVN